MPRGRHTSTARNASLTIWTGKSMTLRGAVP